MHKRLQPAFLAPLIEALHLLVLQLLDFLDPLDPKEASLQLM